jgi:hypothetical protein
LHQELGFKALSEKMGFQNKIIGSNGDESATYSNSGISVERLADDFSGILSFN